MNLSPSLLTAAIAGAFSAIALPLLRNWMGDHSGIGIPLIIAMVVTVAIPAQAFVVGTTTHTGSGARSLDMALLKRIGVWILAAAVVTGIRWVM